VTAGDSDDEEKLDASALLQRLQADDDDDEVTWISSGQVNHSSYTKVIVIA